MSLLDTGAAPSCDGGEDAEAAAPATPSPTALLDIYWPYLWDEPAPPAPLGYDLPES